MRRQSTTTIRSGIGVLAALSMTVTGLAQVGQAAPDTSGASSDGGAATGVGRTTAITLITGDTVHVTDVGDGRRALQLDPAEGREDVDIHQLEVDGDLYVLPLDVIPDVAADRLDRELFNVDALIEMGYDDASVDTLPLITTYDGSRLRASATSELGRLEAVEPGETLETIDAQALAVDKTGAAEFWQQLADVEVEKVWLDSVVRPALHESVEQIGAPAAWDAGVDGTGVTVAVLDSGVDADHPDLVGQVVAAENFSSSGDTADRVGHGTHVAATIAGTGAASDGLRKGVAPGADIISGKVLGDDGSGTLSQVIAGMEWAVEQGADVVNLSLGSGPTDGTDPLSQAVNDLAAGSDTLFVVAAGNDGPGAQTIGSPGTADAALTVGAVDRDESMADFSSRGPRPGDLAVKPDITAPGVGIVAARAAGTSMGSPLDDLYTAANGTSMATPHVAGAAALLLSRHPDWDGDRLKDALVSTALLGEHTAYEQGGGRVDVARAISQPVVATGTLDLGSFVDEDGGVTTHDVTWVNTGSADVELALELDLARPGGEPPAPGAVELGADTVTVPAGSTARVTVTVRADLLQRGQYTGYLHAAGGDVATHTTLRAGKEAPTHEVTFRGVGFDGEPEYVTPLVVFGEDPRFDSISFVKPGETRTFTLAEGDYFLHAMMSPSVDGEDSRVVVTDPDLEVTGDMEVVLDARDATRVRIETPKPADLRGHLGFTTYRAVHGRRLSNSTMVFDSVRSVWVTPTEEAEGGEFEFSSRWQLGAPPLVGRTVGGGKPFEAWLRYERMSPLLRSSRPLELVDAGTGTPEELAAAGVEGKVAVVSLRQKGEQDPAAAAEAGAVALMIAPTEFPWWTKYTGRGARDPLPVVALGLADAAEVRSRLAGRGTVRMTFSGSPDPAYTYDVMQVSRGRIPEQVVHRVDRTNSATIDAAYHEMGGEEWAKEQRFAWRPWQTTTIIEQQQELHTPQRRTETVSAGDTLWRQHVLHFYSWDSLNPLNGGAIHPIRSYEPGEHVAYDWFAAVVAPAQVPGTEATRTGDVLRLRIPEIAMQGGEMYDRAANQARMTLRRDGEVLHEGTAAWGDLGVPAGAATYELNLAVTRETDQQWEYSTRTDTTWTFRSDGGAGTEVLPLLDVDYDVPVGLSNTVPGLAVRPVTFTVGHPEGVDRPAKVTSAKAWVSVDDGETWVRLPLVPAGRGEFRTIVLHPWESGHVSLRFQATDAAGNAVDQTVIRAYGVAGR